MTLRTILLVTTLLTSTPVLAAIDPPAAGKDDPRIRSVVYDPTDAVKIYTVPGASLRLELGSDEEVVSVVVSDQDTIRPDPMAPPPVSTVSTNPLAGQGNVVPPSCDANLCRTVAGNIVYIKPIRELDAQPLFIQTKRIDANGKTEMVPYTFELLTANPMDKKPMVWGVHFVYPERVKQQAAADLKRRQQAWAASAHETAALAHPVLAVPPANANWRYGYRGSAAVEPDEAWDDGRTTFLRYNGNRRVPNLYSRLPDGEKSIPASAPEPDQNGTTLRIARTETKWYIWDGDEAGCVFNIGPDPDGRASATVAMASPKAGQR